MKIAIYVRQKSGENLEGRRALESALRSRGMDVAEGWEGGEGACQREGVDVVVSIGGDGTLLDAVHKLGGSGTAVLGVNFGHLGFLTTAGRCDLERLADCLRDGDFSIEKRGMLDVTVEGADGFRCRALNEVYLHRDEKGRMLRTRAEVDGIGVATFVADGLIVATPTGSTAYSLSCGGPILTPDSGCVVVTPIAAHSLTQRPIVLNDSVVLRLWDEEGKVATESRREGLPEGTEKRGMILGVDSETYALRRDSVIEIRRADYELPLIRIGKQNFFSAIRDKLMWGMG